MDDVIRGGVCRFVMLRLHCRHFTWNGLEWPGITAMPNRCTKISAGTGTGTGTGTVIVTVSGTVPGTVIVTVTVPGTVTVTVPGPVTVTVPVPVTRLGPLGSSCASCGLLYGYYEARRVEGWLSMRLRQGRLYCLPAGFSTLRPVVANSRLLNVSKVG